MRRRVSINLRIVLRRWMFVIWSGGDMSESDIGSRDCGNGVALSDRADRADDTIGGLQT